MTCLTFFGMETSLSGPDARNTMHLCRMRRISVTTDPPDPLRTPDVDVVIDRCGDRGVSELPRARHRVIATGVPETMRAASQLMFALARRTQPWETAVPGVPPRFATVQCDLARPAVDSCRTLERALNARAYVAPG